MTPSKPNLGLSTTDTPVNPSDPAQGIALDIDAKLLYEAYALKPLNLAMTGIVAIGGAVLLWSHVNPAVLGGWLAALLMATALGCLEYWWFMRTQPVGAAVRKMQVIFMGQSVLAGAAWALGPTLMIWQGIDTPDALVVGVLLCVGAVGMTTIAAQKSAMQGFIAATLVPPAIAALITDGAMGQIVTLTLLVAAVALIKLGSDASNTLRAVMQAQIQLQAVLDSALDAVVSMDAQGRITAWSRRAHLLLGWHQEEVQDKVLNEFILRAVPGALRESGLARMMKGATESNLNRRIEMLAKHRDGYEILVEVATTRLILGGKAVKTAFIADISERKATQERLALFRRVFDASNQSIVISDAKGRGLYQNHAHAQAMGYSDDEIIGKPFTHALAQDVASAAWADIKRAIAQEGAWEGQVPFRRKNGSEFMTASHIGSIKDEQGNIQYVFNLFTDSTQELERLEELKLAKEAAERANLAKSDFLSSMSHELRTPMNAVLGFAQILEFDDSLTPDQLDNVAEILKGGRQLLKLIDEVLDLAKIESSSIRLTFETVNVAGLIDEAWRVLAPLALTRSIVLHKHLPLDASVTADRGRLKQVLLNLLSNAINFNRDGGEISVYALEMPTGQLRIEVVDRGQGIAPARLPVIFEAFNRRDTVRGQVGGTGIGLIITRRLMNLMGGEVGVQSELGVGSTFWVDLPQVNNTAATPIATAPVPLSDNLAQFDGSVHQYSVLCIDDNPINLKLIGHLLAKRPRIHLITAHTPGLGIQLALGRQPDLILLDINMPGMDGYQVMEVLKTYARTQAIPIIAVTANATPRSVALGGSSGLAGYLTKPLDAEMFLATVDHWLDKGRGNSPN